MLEKEIRVKFEFCLETPDFKVINDLINWCDTYTRNRILVFHFMKNATTYLVQLERDMDFEDRIKSLFIFVRYFNTHKGSAEKNIEEFLTFIKKKFKKAKPIINSSNIIKGLKEDIK